MAASSSIIDLRRLLAERFPQTFTPGVDHLRTGLPAIDGVAGGLPKKAITELTTRNLSAGSALLIHALLQQAHRESFF